MSRVDPLRVATRTISGLSDGSTTGDLDEVSIRTAAALIVEEPEYSRLAARLLGVFITKEVRGQGIMSFSQAIAHGAHLGIIGEATARFVADYSRKLDDAIRDSPESTFEFFGLRTVYERYLLRQPTERTVIELPQYFLPQVACGIGLAFHRVRSQGSLIRGTNGLFNGIIPFLKTLDASVAAVNQGGRRKGAACAYLETWHADIEDSFELKDNTGDDACRAHHLNIADWVPDLFMERVEKDW